MDINVNIIKNLIRIGKVSSINAEKATVKVAYMDKDNMVSDDLQLVMLSAKDVKSYKMPSIGSVVLCIFLPNPSGNGLAQGYVIGEVYTEADKPVQNSVAVTAINFPDGSFIKYENGIIEINAASAIKITAPRVDIN